MTEQGKTIGQLNVQPGDVVRCVDDNGQPWWTAGQEYSVCEDGDGPIIEDNDGDHWLGPDALFIIVSRAAVEGAKP